MSKAFIAYSREQELFATRLARSLSDIGVDVWIDVDDIPPGMKWHRAIQQGLDECEIMLVVISPDSMASDHVQNEYFYFIDEKKPVIPILYKTTPVPALLRPLHYINFESQTYNQAFAQLHTELLRRGFQIAPVTVGDHPVNIPKQSLLPLEENDPSVSLIEKLYWLARRNALRSVFGVISAIVLAVIIGEGDIRQNISNVLGSGTSGTPIAQISTPTTDLTATEAGILSTNATSTAEQIAAIETAAYATLLALSATPTATNTPTLTPTPFHQFHLLPLENASFWDENGTLGLIVEGGGLEQREFLDIQFEIGRGISTFGCGDGVTDNVELITDVFNPVSVYLLIQAGNASSRYEGLKLGSIRLLFSDGRYLIEDLIVGYNIRDWARNFPNSVTTVTSAQTVEAWRGFAPNGREGGIDMLTIPIPETYLGATLTNVEVSDTSDDAEISNDLCIHLTAVTVEVAP